MVELIVILVTILFFVDVLSYINGIDKRQEDVAKEAKEYYNWSKAKNYCEWLEKNKTKLRSKE